MTSEYQEVQRGECGDFTWSLTRLVEPAPEADCLQWEVSYKSKRIAHGVTGERMQSLPAMLVMLLHDGLSAEDFVMTARCACSMRIPAAVLTL